MSGGAGVDLYAAEARAQRLHATSRGGMDVAEDARLLVEEVRQLRTALAAAERERDNLALRHATMRSALSFVHAWPDGVTGKRMVDAEDILTILAADKPKGATP